MAGTMAVSEQAGRLVIDAWAGSVNVTAGYGDSVEVALRSLPGMRGAVRMGAAALEGASVTAHVAIAEDEQYICQGLPARHLRQAIAKATTDARGEFVLTLRESGNYWVRAKAEGLLPAPTNPVTPGVLRTTYQASSFKRVRTSR